MQDLEPLSASRGTQAYWWKDPQKNLEMGELHCPQIHPPELCWVMGLHCILTFVFIGLHFADFILLLSVTFFVLGQEGATRGPRTSP